MGWFPGKSCVLRPIFKFRTQPVAERTAERVWRGVTWARGQTGSDVSREGRHQRVGRGGDEALGGVSEPIGTIGCQRTGHRKGDQKGNRPNGVMESWSVGVDGL